MKQSLFVFLLLHVIERAINFGTACGRTAVLGVIARRLPVVRLGGNIPDRSAIAAAFFPRTLLRGHWRCFLLH